MDFHRLRKTYCVLLRKAGLQPKIIQKLMRCSDVRLTMNMFGDDVDEGELRDAVKLLRAVDDDEAGRSDERKTA